MRKVNEPHEPRALTAKFSGFIHPTIPSDPIPGPFRVVLIRDGGLYRGFFCPTGAALFERHLKLETARVRASQRFTVKLEDWTECEPSKGLPV